MRVFFLMAAFLSILSCVDGLFEELSRPLADPSVSLPEVKSFGEEKVVSVSWESDSCADEYILYRRKDDGFSANQIIYRGRDLSYSDRSGSYEERYLYCLSKIRGIKEFGPSEAVMGVFGSTREDFFEPNDTPAMASNLLYDLEANCFHYQGVDGYVVSDTDWYSVLVPPRRVVNVLLIQTGLNTGDTAFSFYQEGKVPFRITNNSDIPIPNYSYEEVRVYFKIFPVESEFLNDITQPGGSVVGYTLSLHLITTL